MKDPLVVALANGRNEIWGPWLVVEYVDLSPSLRNGKPAGPANSP